MAYIENEVSGGEAYLGCAFYDGNNQRVGYLNRDAYQSGWALSTAKEFSLVNAGYSIKFSNPLQYYEVRLSRVQIVNTNNNQVLQTITFSQTVEGSTYGQYLRFFGEGSNYYRTITIPVQENKTFSYTDVYNSSTFPAYCNAHTGAISNGVITSTEEKDIKLEIVYRFQYRLSESSQWSQTIEEKGTFTLSFKKPLLNSIYVKTLPNKTVFDKDETFSSDGLVVYGIAQYQVAQTTAYENAISLYDLTVPSTSTTGSKTVSISYGLPPLSTSYQVVVIDEDAPSSITSNLDSILSSSYYTGDTLDFSGLVVKAYYETQSGTVERTIASGYTLKVKNKTIPPSTYVLMPEDIGEDVSLSIEYGGKTTNKLLTIILKQTVSISVDTTGMTKALNDYVVGQVLDLSGLVITGTYNTGNTQTISYQDNKIKVVDSSNNVIDKDKVLNLGDDDLTLYIQYTNESDIALTKVSLGTLNVVEDEVVSLIIVNYPNKLSYTYGDKLDLTGLVLKATYKSGNEVLTSSSQGIIIHNTSDIASGHIFAPASDTVFGDKTIVVSYLGLTKSFTISFVKPVLVSVKVDSSSVKKTFVNGETFTLSSLVVYNVYANGWEELNDSYTTNASTVLGFGANDSTISVNTYGEKEITITAVNPYDSSYTKTGSYTINVYSDAPVEATLIFDVEIDYKNYKVGEKYTAKGVYIKVKDQLDNIYYVTDFKTSIEKETVLRSAQRINVGISWTKGSITIQETYTITVNIDDSPSLTETNDYQIVFGSTSGYKYTEFTHDGKTIKVGEIYKNGVLVGEFYPVVHSNLAQIDNNVSHTDTYGMNIYTGSNISDDAIGYLDLGLNSEDGQVLRHAHLVLFEDVDNPISGQGNIEVVFPHYIEGASDKINKSHFGIVYHNRLFVSGNPEYKNCDFHSSDVNLSQIENYTGNSNYDLTYFSDLDYCFYGSDETAIVGYDIYRDGDLIVIKEDSRTQATLYRRSYQLVNATNYMGDKLDSDLYEEAYPMFDINKNGGIGGLSNRGVINFFGETLMLAKTGLKAITNKEDVYNTAKYVKDVSTYIDHKIVNEDLKNAFLYSFKKMLLLKTSRGVYVGYYDLRNQDNEYEWYFLTGLNADLFFEYQDQIYFANNDGDLCRLDDKAYKYEDIDRIFVGTGGATLSFNETLLVNEATNALVITSTAYDDYIKEGNTFHILTIKTNNGLERKSFVYASIGELVNKEIYNSNNALTQDYQGLIDNNNNNIVIKYINQDKTEDIAKTEIVANRFYDGKEIYLDHIQGDTFENVDINKKYVLKKVQSELFTDVYKLYENDTEISLNGIDSVRVSYVINEKEITRIADIEDVDGGGKQFKLIGNHDQELDLIEYNNETGSYQGVISIPNNVSAYFITAPYNFGDIIYTKTIWGWVIANDTQLGSYMDIGYISSRKQGSYVGYSSIFDIETYKLIAKASAGARRNEYKDLEFSKVQFLSDKLPHIYTRNKTIPTINFIRFLFRNNENSNIVLTTLELIYTNSENTKGAK